ncbi:pilus assembly protein [Pseudogulbenkiania sp. MAI-1]|uniref:pilus assembly protein n=1 Tax=Pseudogulbenkiania sp. MAI-1 TaxID=990370 RepID=UPI00045EBD21|nr:PilC/PilY family type IV pilus protein [Pseudogulbenkiania sp. MAI-1]
MRRRFLSLLSLAGGLLLPVPVHPADSCTLPADHNPYPSAPPQLSTRVTPNILLFFDNSGSMAWDVYGNTGQKRERHCNWWGCWYGEVLDPLQGETRLQIAKDVTKGVIDAYPDVRWGLFSFDPSNSKDTVNGLEDLRYSRAGRLVAEIGGGKTHLDTVKSAIDNLGADTNTPLAEAYYEMTRYYRGMTSAYFKPVNPASASRGSGNYVSPVQYRCQANFVLMMTDGEPTEDNEFPLTADPLYAGFVLGRDNPLPDFAKHAASGDLFTSGSDSEGQGWDSAPFARQSLKTYTIGFTVDNQLLQDTAKNGSGRYFTASDKEQLKASFTSAMDDIYRQNSTATPPVSGEQKTTALLHTTFDTQTWTSRLLSYPVNAKGKPDYSKPTDALLPDWDRRTVYTSYYDNHGNNWVCNKSSTGKVFDGNVVAQAFKPGMADNDKLTFGRQPNDVIHFVLGHAMPGQRFAGNKTPWLGDIIDSPLTTFSSRYAQLVAVGGNDGMLHLFRKESGETAYREALGYVPFEVLTRLIHLTKADYGTSTNPHRYYVNGPSVVQTVDDGRSYLAGTLGQGGKALFALDVSSLLSESGKVAAPAEVVRWEAGAASGSTALGYVFGRPVIAKVRHPATGASVWAVLSGNGYDSAGGQAALLVFALDSGALLGEIKVGAAGGNGLSGPAVLDVDADKVADYVYAGDLKGNVWRFDLRGDWAAPERPFWQGDASQPVTATPALYKRPSGGGYMVLFGTGRLLYDSDRRSTTPQSVYGLWDTPPSSRHYQYGDRDGAILAQSLDGEAASTVPMADGSSRRYTVRRTTRNAVAIGDGAAGGWYLDLAANSGERLLHPPLLVGERLYFTTQIPFVSSLQCSVGGDGWIMSLDPLSGAAPARTAFDLNGDDKGSSADWAVFETGKAAQIPSGVRSMVGMPSALSLFASQGSNYQWLGYADQNGQINNRDNANIAKAGAGLRLGFGGSAEGMPGDLAIPPGAGKQGRRLAWREIF